MIVPSDPTIGLPVHNWGGIYTKPISQPPVASEFSSYVQYQSYQVLNVVSPNLVSICVATKATANFTVRSNTQIVVMGYQIGWTRTSTPTLMSFGWAPPQNQYLHADEDACRLPHNVRIHVWNVHSWSEGWREGRRRREWELGALAIILVSLMCIPPSWAGVEAATHETSE